jgi:hypothetical protein
MKILLSVMELPPPSQLLFSFLRSQYTNIPKPTCMLHFPPAPAFFSLDSSTHSPILYDPIYTSEKVMMDGYEVQELFRYTLYIDFFSLVFPKTRPLFLLFAYSLGCSRIAYTDRIR